MAKAVFLHEREPPPVERVIAAAASCEDLTESDARRWTANASGVLAMGLADGAAAGIARGLTAAGYGASVVDEAWLQVPEPTVVRRALVKLSGFIVHDAHGGPRTHGWENVLAVNAGVIVVGQRVRTKDMQVSVRAAIDGPEVEIDEAEYRYQESDRIVMDVVVVDPLRRYRIESDAFDYGVLGKRKTAHAAENFATLATDIVGYASAATGRGVEQLITASKTTVRHRSPRTFDAELAWLLWRHHGPGSALDGATDYRREPFAGTDQPVDTFTERARKHTADRVIAENHADHERHMAAHRRLDMALAALAGVVAAAFATSELGYVHVAGEWQLSPVRFALAGLTTLLVVTPIAHAALRRWRSHRFWWG